MMEYKGYVAHVDFDEEADIFHGEVVNIRDVVTFEGRSVDELKQAFEESIEDYLDLCASRNESPEEPFSGLFTIRLSPEQHRNVVLAAERAGQRVDSWVAEMLSKSTKENS